MQRLLTACLLIFLAACSLSPEARKKRDLENGNKFFDKGKYKEARIMYLRAVKEDPRFGEGYYRLALTNMRLGSYGESVSNLRRAVELQPDNMDAHNRLAELYLTAFLSNPTKYKTLVDDIRDLSGKLEKRAKGSYEDIRLKGYLALADEKAPEALDLFQKADKIKPGQTQVKMAIARTLLTLRKPDEAITVLQGVVRDFKGFGPAYDLLYRLYMHLGKVDLAEQVAVQRVTNNPKEASVRLALAAHYLLVKKRDEMDKILAELQGNQKDFPNGSMAVGDFLYRLRDYPRASQAYQAGEKKDPDQKWEYRKRDIETRVAQGRPQEALEMTEVMLKENPKDPEAIAMRASLWLYAGKPEQIATAISEMESVVSKMPENFVLRYNLGRAKMTKRDLDGAKQQFQDAIKFRPDYLPARIGLAQVFAARREYGAAITAANEILKYDPNNAFARLIQSQAYFTQGKYADSKVLLEQILKINPNQRDARYQLGYTLFKLKDLKGAETEFQRIYEANPPDMRGVMGLTEVYVVQGDNDRALKLLDKEIARFPKSTALKVAWANVATRVRRYDEAFKMYREVASLDPKNADVYMRMGEVYRQKGDVGNALEMWKKAGDMIPNAVMPRLMRATALTQIGRSSEAAPLYEQILKIESDNLVALNNLSFYLADQGNTDLALTYATKAKLKSPNDPMVSDTLGYVYLKKNLPQNAISIFADLTAKYPTISMFHLRLATAYMQQGNLTAAKKSLDEARRRTDPKRTVEQEEIKKLAAKLG